MNNNSPLLDYGAALRAQELKIASCWHLQLKPRLMAKLTEQLGAAEFPEPHQHRRWRIAGGELLHLDGDQWLALGLSISPQALSKAASRQPYACVDLSHCLCRLQLRGPSAGSALQRIFSADIGPSALPSDTARLGELAGVSATILHHGSGDYHLFINRGYLQYVLEQLRSVLPQQP